MVRMDKVLQEADVRSFRCVGGPGGSPDEPMVSSSPIDDAAWTSDGHDSNNQRFADHFLFQGDTHGLFSPDAELDARSVALTVPVASVTPETSVTTGPVFATPTSPAESNRLSS